MFWSGNAIKLNTICDNNSHASELQCVVYNVQPIVNKSRLAIIRALLQAVRVLVLAPSKELCRQIGEMAEKIASGCCREIRVLDLSLQVPLDHQRPLLAGDQ